MMNDRATTPADFQPWELEAYLDGEDLPHVAEFLAHNPAVLAELRQTQARTGELHKTLYRFDCPDPDLLQAYHWGELDSPVRRQLEAHLQECPQCSAEVASFQAFVDEPLPAVQGQSILSTVQQTLREQMQALVDSVRIVVATVVTPATPQMAGVALRSEPHAATMSQQLLFEVEGVDISIMAHQPLKGVYRLDGQLFTATPIATATFTLTAASPSVTAVTGAITVTGSFSAANLPPGDYHLVLNLADQAIVVPNLVLA